MTTPIETIVVTCPKCGKEHSTSYRASMNLMLDNFDDEYIEEMSTTHCPYCGLYIQLGGLVVRDDSHWEFLLPIANKT